MDWQKRIRAVFERSHANPEDDVVLELAQHASSAWHAARADGASTEDADRQVQALVEQWCADARVSRRRPRRPAAVEPPAASRGRLTGLAMDLRYGLRLLARQRAFTALAVLTLALGIGATTTLASVAYHVLAKPLPFATAGRLVRLTETREGSTRVLPPSLTNGTYLAWMEAPQTLDGIAGWGTETVTFTASDRTPERLRMADCTASLFGVLGVHPAAGTLFTEEDEKTREEDVVLLSFDFWQREFGGRADAIGGRLMLDGHPRTILGVMPRGFAFPDPEIVLWAPMSVPPVVPPDAPDSRRIRIFDAVGLLKPGASAAQASAEGTARAKTAPDPGMTAIAVFGSRGAPLVTAQPLVAAMTADVRPALLLFLGAVGLLFAAAVANISSLQLARATARRREIAIRAALGAGGRRIARQLLIENAIVGLAGGAGGLLLAAWLNGLLPALLPASFPRASEIAVDWRMMLFALILAVGASLVCGVLPSALARRQRLVSALVEDSLAPVGGRLRSFVGRMRNGILAGQMAIAVLLLVGASLLAQTFVRLERVDRGYDPTHLLTAQIPLPSPAYDAARRTALLDDLMRRLRGTPGVTHVATTGILPLMRGEMLKSFVLPPRGPGEEAVTVQALARIVSDDYFATLGMRIAQGRGFAETDSLTSEPVVVVSRTFVRTYLDDRPIGASLPAMFDRGKAAWRVVGVVDDVRQQNATDPPRPEIFACSCQISAGVETGSPVLAVRTAGDPGALIPTVRSLVREADPAVALQSIVTMDDRLAANLATPRLDAVLVGAFALLALLIAAVGLVGVLSYNVAQRVREIGIRAALGASPAAIVRLVLKEGMTVAASGGAIGLGAAFVFARELETFLFGVAAHDTATFVAVPLVLLAVAALTSAVPARRAARIDPLVALRQP